MNSTGTTAPATEQIGTLLILGASGDLAGRLLLPGLGRLLATGRAPDLTLVGSGVEDWDDERWRERLRQAFAVAPSIEVPPWERQEPAPDEPGSATLRRLEVESVYLPADVSRRDDLQRLLDAGTGPVAIYFALPPAATEIACETLAECGVPAGTRLIMEKPYGSDGPTARRLNALVTRIVPEDHVHRIDHFLGKSTVLNLLGLRFANRIFEPVWNASHVDAVEIIYDEDLGLEDRARYYDAAGALRDMIQSHLLQVLALVAMDPPATMGERDVRDRTAEVLRATRAGDPREHSRRARYAAGRIGERDLPAYTDEPGVAPERETETLAEVTCFIDSWRWKGVPFLLRSAKGIGTARKEVVVTFKTVPHLPQGLTGTSTPARLRIGLGPDCLNLELDVNGSGDPWSLDRVVLSTEFGTGELPAYGEVLAGVLEGDPLLSVRGDAVEECWRIVEPVLAAWEAGEVPLAEYPAGAPSP
ncbi:glucose-6-phosphate dehydrogenase [Georgenia wangjunii]|uniref:glucose-6-phosphate dehydrogenase n=1 Tax=Georgenia wangjunii TaxID=3117730 RepID=UPI002F265A38